MYRYENKRLQSFKNKHSGERCFIIGNGPSLTPGDLEKIGSEVSLAVNGIYNIFDKTTWRPSYYFIADDKGLEEMHKTIRESIDCPIFYDFNAAMRIDDFSLVNEYFFLLDGSFEFDPAPNAKPVFSENPLMPIVCATVIYNCLQMAAYMGFSEIYMLGIDNSYPVTLKTNGEIMNEDSLVHFYEGNSKAFYIPNIETLNAAYSSAKEYAQSRGIKIYNATRGGKLEIFERVVFDELFNICDQ